LILFLFGENDLMKKLIILTSLFATSTFSMLTGSEEEEAEQRPLPEEMGIFDVIPESEKGGKEPPVLFPELEGEMAREAKAADEPVEKEAEKSKEEKYRLEAMINEYVEFGGAIEMEYSWVKGFDGSSSSDISLETAELDFEISLTDWDVGELAIEWEPDDDELTVKEAFVTFGNLECFPWFLQTGRLFVPFGISTGAVVGDTLTITDPLTIEIFETREDVLLIGYERNGFHTSAYVFNGDTNPGGGNDHIEHYGGTIRYGKEFCNMSYGVGIDYLSSIFDSDSLTDEFPEALEARYVPGIALHGRLFLNGFSLILEYNGALRSAKFMEDDEDLKLAPEAWQVELGYTTKICCKETYFSLNYSESHDLEGTFPRRRFLANLGIWFYDSILLGFEYGHDVDYSESHGGTGNTADFLISQLTYEW